MCTGYTNHCLNCLYLYSKYVNANPRDRASDCKDIMVIGEKY